ncbi:ABC transporter permease subunit [Microbacterium sp.]|uniref:ABC transporter permease subunit n=1 Tax=Microbacterium sp. TaxID=51671 RepID=UPI0039E72668
MSTLTAPAPARSTIVAPSTARLSFGRVLRSEWIKLATLRSTWWSLGIAVALSVGISLLMAAALSDADAGFPAVMTIVMPLQFTMLVAGILGAIAVTGEYSTGMIRSTLAAEPRRGAVLAAKALVIAAVLAVATLVGDAIAIAATAPILSTQIDWSDATVSILPLAFGMLSMMVFALIGLSFGFVIRNGAGAIAATVGLLFVAPVVVSIFSMFGQSWRWIVDLGRYLPMNAAAAITTPGGRDDLWPEVLALLAWAVVGLGAGWAVLRTRDA